jgi:hypothetical protein
MRTVVLGTANTHAPPTKECAAANQTTLQTVHAATNQDSACLEFRNNFATCWALWLNFTPNYHHGIFHRVTVTVAMFLQNGFEALLLRNDSTF